MDNQTITPQARHNKGHLLLLENDALLRRTVVMTARSLSLGDIHETGDPAVARRMLTERKFSGAVIALDFGERKYYQYDLTIIDAIRAHEQMAGIPIAVLASQCDAALLQELQQRQVTRVILKPFRARTLLDTFIALRDGA
jgi:CheY-like chemotaxis protein